MKVKKAYEARYAAYKIERDNGKSDAEISEIIGLSVRTLEGNHYHYRYNKEKKNRFQGTVKAPENSLSFWGLLIFMGRSG